MVTCCSLIQCVIGGADIGPSGFVKTLVRCPETRLGTSGFGIRSPDIRVGESDFGFFCYSHPDFRVGLSGRRNLPISDIPTSESDCRDLGIFHFRHPEIRVGMSGCRLTENPTFRHPSRSLGMSAYGKSESRNPIVCIGISKNVGPTVQCLPPA